MKNRVSHPDAPACIDDVISKIASVIQKSRVVLSEEDLTLLESCLEDLQKMKANPPQPQSLIEDVGRIAVMLLKFFINDGQLD